MDPINDLNMSKVSHSHEVIGPLIPVFASVPSKLSVRQKLSKSLVSSRLMAGGLEPRTVGGSDPAMLNPLHEVRTLARHCAGGIILGYSQITATVAETLQWKDGEDTEQEPEPRIINSYIAATPWNQLETGILFGLGLPLFVLKEEGVNGGIFDAGSSDVLVHTMPMPKKSWNPGSEEDPWLPRVVQSFELALRRWQAMVIASYYRFPREPCT